MATDIPGDGIFCSLAYCQSVAHGYVVDRFRLNPRNFRCSSYSFMGPTIQKVGNFILVENEANASHISVSFGVLGMWRFLKSTKLLGHKFGVLSNQLNIINNPREQRYIQHVMAEQFDKRNMVQRHEIQRYKVVARYMRCQECLHYKRQSKIWEEML